MIGALPGGQTAGLASLVGAAFKLRPGCWGPAMPPEVIPVASRVLGWDTLLCDGSASGTLPGGDFGVRGRGAATGQRRGRIMVTLGTRRARCEWARFRRAHAS